MNNKITVFTNDYFGTIRTLEIDGEPWLVGKDVAEILGYANARNAITAHVDDEDKTTALIQGTGSNYKSKTTIINESGVYSLVLGSKLPSAKKFKRWITSEVLPSIRKTGGYNTEELENIKSELSEIRTELIKATKPKKTYSFWFSRMHPKYKLIEESLGITRGALYREILKELTNRYNLDTFQIEKNYLFENGLDKCYPLDPYQAVAQYRLFIEEIIDKYLLDNDLATKEELVAQRQFKTIFNTSSVKGGEFYG
nr:MAG TPA: repressor domain protein [Caudoviricetes sp.]